jgi:hypothetical protein
VSLRIVVTPVFLQWSAALKRRQGREVDLGDALICAPAVTKSSSLPYLRFSAQQYELSHGEIIWEMLFDFSYFINNEPNKLLISFKYYRCPVFFNMIYEKNQHTKTRLTVIYLLPFKKKE